MPTTTTPQQEKLRLRIMRMVRELPDNVAAALYRKHTLQTLDHLAKPEEVPPGTPAEQVEAVKVALASADQQKAQMLARTLSELFAELDEMNEDAEARAALVEEWKGGK